ncbi:MAG: GNAT family N-acetyltransferase [Thermoanaerobaculia bacterium]
MAAVYQALNFTPATPEHAAALAELHGAAARRVVEVYGPGPWGHGLSERSVARSLGAASVVVAWRGGEVVGTATLTRKKPWAIDLGYFQPVRAALYLVNMAVHPHHQRQGVGRALLDHCAVLAREGSALALRLDAFDGAAGAGAFYARCGFREVGRKVYRGTPLVYFELLLAPAG